MSPAAIIALVRDAVILGALTWIILFIYHAGQNADIKADMKALEKQLLANSAQEAKWRQESTDAQFKRDEEMRGVIASIGNQHAPVWVCKSAGGGTLPGTAATPAGGPASPGRPPEGPRIDIRPQLNAFETKYEGYLAACRAVLNQWPQ